MPFLFKESAEDFRAQSADFIGALDDDCISCIVTEERNGIFELELEYPHTGAFVDDIVPDAIITAPHDATNHFEPFRIYRVEKNLDDSIKVSARHVFFGINHYAVDRMTAKMTGTTAQAVINWIDSHVINAPSEVSSNNFPPYNVYVSGLSTTADFFLEFPKTIGGALFESGGIVETFGGEVKYDGFNCTIYGSRGALSPVTIRYGENLAGEKREIDSSGQIYKCLGYGTVKLPAGTETFTKHLSMAEYADNKYTPIAVVDLSEKLDGNWDNLTLILETENYALFNKDKSDVISVDYAHLPTEAGTIKLCDEVTIISPLDGFQSRIVKCTKTVYDAILKLYDSLEFGNQATLTNVISNAQDAQAKTNATTYHVSSAINSLAEHFKWDATNGAWAGPGNFTTPGGVRGKNAIFSDGSVVNNVVRCEHAGANGKTVEMRASNAGVTGIWSTTYATPAWMIYSDGEKVTIPHDFYLPNTYSLTTSNAANMFIYSNGRVLRSTASSRRYKHDIKLIDDSKALALLQIPVHEFKFNSNYISPEDEQAGKDVIGLIAEEVDEALPIAAQHSDGQVENWNERILLPALLRLVQMQNDQIEDLQKRLEKLEG